MKRVNIDTIIAAVLPFRQISKEANEESVENWNVRQSFWSPADVSDLFGSRHEEMTCDGFNLQDLCRSFLRGRNRLDDGYESNPLPADQAETLQVCGLLSWCNSSKSENTVVY